MREHECGPKLNSRMRPAASNLKYAADYPRLSYPQYIAHFGTGV
jgi:hypothetical protein